MIIRFLQDYDDGALRAQQGTVFPVSNALAKRLIRDGVAMPETEVQEAFPVKWKGGEVAAEEEE